MTRMLHIALSAIAALALVVAFAVSPVSAQSSKLKTGTQPSTVGVSKVDAFTWKQGVVKQGVKNPVSAQQPKIKAPTTTRKATGTGDRPFFVDETGIIPPAQKPKAPEGLATKKVPQVAPKGAATTSPPLAVFTWGGGYQQLPGGAGASQKSKTPKGLTTKKDQGQMAPKGHGLGLDKRAAPKGAATTTRPSFVEGLIGETSIPTVP
jgi:hypothetical protein